MTTSSPSSKVPIIVACALLAVGIAVFSVRFLHEGAYPVPRGANLFGGLGALVVGGILFWSTAPRALGRLALAASPVVLFFGLYATMSELEEVVSLYAADSAGRSAELRLWIVDREDGEWVGMQHSKAIEHSLDGARLQVLRRGKTRCVVPVLHKDRPTVEAIHALKVGKYAVARASAMVGLYPSEASATTVALRLDLCP
ncbi:MAG: hypothetical protein ACI8TX_000335 [Hyphomicrobiaceae bacterium]|jgi:hypothetical protein